MIEDKNSNKMIIRLNNKRFKTLEQLIKYMRFNNIEEVEFIDEDEFKVIESKQKK